MAFANYSAFYSSLQEQNALPVQITGTVVTALRLHDLYRLTMVPSTGVGPAIPTTAAALTKADTSALNYYLPNYTPEVPYIIGARVNTAGARGAFLIVDRLSHQGGLDGTAITTQTTNLPTAALTRYTDGVGVMIGLTIYTTIGATGTTVTASYTNQAGTPGRTTVAQAIGATGFNAAGRMIILPLAAGDTGARSVESVTLTATTGTAGNFGVTLFKVLGGICVYESQGVFVGDIITGGVVGGLASFDDNAHLSLLFVGDNTTSSGGMSLLIGEA